MRPAFGGGSRKSQPGKFGASSQLASAKSSNAVRPAGRAAHKVNSFGAVCVTSVTAAAERRPDAGQPFAGGGLAVELPVARGHQPQLRQLGQLFQAERGDLPVIIEQIGLAEFLEQFRRQRCLVLGPLGKNSPIKKSPDGSRNARRFGATNGTPPGNLVVGHHHGSSRQS